MRALCDRDIAMRAARALERIAFVFAEIESQGGNIEPSNSSWIEYASQVECGHLTLRADKGFVGELAGNMLGIDPSGIDPLTEGAQALDELANVLAGEIVLALGSEDIPYRLTVPKRGQGPTEGAPASAACRLRSEGGNLEIELWRQPVSEH